MSGQQEYTVRIGDEVVGTGNETTVVDNIREARQMATWADRYGQPVTVTVDGEVYGLDEFAVAFPALDW